MNPFHAEPPSTNKTNCRFFNIGEFVIAGCTIKALNHTMSGVPGQEMTGLEMTGPSEQGPEVMAAPIGLDGLVFGSEDAAETFAALREADLPFDPPQALDQLVLRRRVATFIHCRRVYPQGVLSTTA